jgi:hypothetical protein
MSGRARLGLAMTLLLGVLCGLLVVVVAGNACASNLPGAPCPDAGRNRTVVVALASLAVMLIVTPFAFLAEFAARRRIVYRGMWLRAVRRGLLVGLAVAALAGLRLGDALSVPAALFVLTMLALLEWSSVRRLDAP